MTMSVVLAGPAYAAASLGLQKTGPTAPVTPGTAFNYTLVASCSSLTESCVNATVTDVLPPEVEVTSLPASNNQRTVDYDAATRTLTVKFIIPLVPPNPPGSVGLPDGCADQRRAGCPGAGEQPDPGRNGVPQHRHDHRRQRDPDHQHGQRHGVGSAGGHADRDQVLE